MTSLTPENVAPIERLTPFNENAARGLKSYNVYDGPKLGFIEQIMSTGVFAT